MMASTSNTSSLVCPTIAWTPQARSCMELPNTLSFRHGMMAQTPMSGTGCSNTGYGGLQQQGITSNSTGMPNAAPSNSSSPAPLSSQYPSHRLSPPQPCLAPAAPTSSNNSLGWTSSPLKHGPVSNSISPPTSSNVIMPPQSQSASHHHHQSSVQRNQTMPLVMLPITAQPVYENRTPLVQPIPHRPSPPQSGPCYYQNVQPHNLSTYPHTMMLGHEPPVSQRERTKPLRDWILKHRSHPYPSKEDKLALAMMTRMRLDQVSMWFANTRRQIRKVGMKAWSGGMFSTPLPSRVGNGAIIPVPEDERLDLEDECSITCSSDDDSSGRIPTDSSCSMD